MRKILCFNQTEAALGIEAAALKKYGDVALVRAAAKSEDELIAAARDAEVILFSAEKLTARVIKALEECKLIIRYGIGYDNVDIAAAKEKNIFVCNAPNYGVADVAEHAFSLMLAVTKCLAKMHGRVQENCWHLNGAGKATRLSGKTVGFLGFGKIGRTVCSYTRPFGTKTLVYDPYVTPDTLRAFDAKAVSLDEILRESDYLTVHLPLNEHTRHMIGKDEFAKMKKSAILVNTARGAVIDEAALVEALLTSEIAGAGIDVFEDETGGFDQRILQADNVVLTPHVAWNTEEATAAVHEEVTANVVKYLNGERPDSIVNGL